MKYLEKYRRSLKKRSFRHCSIYKIMNLDLFTLHNCCVQCSLEFLKIKLGSSSRLPFLEFSSYHITVHRYKGTERQIYIDKYKVIMQGKVIAVAYILEQNL